MLERQKVHNFILKKQSVTVNYGTLLSVTTDSLQPLCMDH